MRTPAEAMAWAMAQTHWNPRSCLNFVDTAYYAGQQSPLGARGIGLPDAKSAWDASPYKVTDGSLPPIGGVMYFDGIPGDEAGDAQLRTGETNVWRTDVGELGRCGSVPIMWMRDTIHHPYLGWTRDFLGTMLFPEGSETASTGTTTLIHKEPEMAQADINNAKAAVVLATYPEKAAVFRKQISGVYKNRLGRAVDQGGLEGFMVGMALGNSITWVDQRVMASPEFRNRQAKLGK